MTQTVSFRYPGDDPTALGTAATRLDEAATRVNRLTQALTISRSRLKDAWTMQAADLADADIGTLMAGLPMVRTTLGTAHTALTTHQATLIRIRADIDDLQTRFRQQAQVWESANHDYQQLSSTAGGSPSLPLTAALATANAATAAQEAIWANYLQLLTDADTSAQICVDALNTSWDPDLQTSGEFRAVDLDAQSRMAATMTHGSGAADVAAQAAADEAHNSQVRPLAAAANVVWDTLSTKLRWSKESFKFFGGNEIDGVFGGLMQDHSVEAQNAAADSTGDVITQASEAAGNQTYAARQQEIPLPGPDQHITLVDVAGKRLSWTQLDTDAQRWVLEHWSPGPNELPDPETAGSHATSAAGGQKGLLLDIFPPETPK